MRIDKLAIKDFKNLRDFSIDFDEKQLTTVLIGQNGTGKSNLFEALVLIFRTLDLGEPPPFGYSIRYICRDQVVEIEADPAETPPYPRITVDGQAKTQAAFTRGKAEYLPAHVFAYYSGPTQRMERLFDKHQRQFYDALLKGEEGTLRPLFYCRLVHSQFVMLVFYAFTDPHSVQFLKEYLGVTGLDSVLFVLSTPEWARGKRKLRPGGDTRFWGSAGTVQRFLDKLWDLSLAPLRRTEPVYPDFRSRGVKQEQLYLFVQDQAKLQELAALFGGAKDFFTNLESTYISDLIREVRIRVEREGVDGFLTFKELSEGEQQLLVVLGLLKFTKQDESLFLLDEPDTHLNPAWALSYLTLLSEVVGHTENSQLIMATHDPLVIGGLSKEEVRVLIRQDEQIVSREPDADPRGMGFAGILKSELYGLRSTVDPATLKTLDRRYELHAKGDDRTEDETRELQRLAGELADMGFAREFRDPYFEEYVKARTRENKFQEPVLSPEQMREREQLAKQIVDEVLAEERAS